MKEIDINEILSKIDIVNVISAFSNLVKSGTSYKTLCNVHGDNSPSLSINPRKQIYKCFVCDHGGNALDYLMWAQKFTFQQALEYLIKESGDDVNNYSFFKNKNNLSQKEINLLKALKDASSLFNYYLNIEIETNEKLKQFIKSRNISKKSIEKFKIGFAPNVENISYIDNLLKKGHSTSSLINASLLNENGNLPFFKNRLIFPIFNENNDVVAFSGRQIENDSSAPKYLNSKESLVFKKSSIIYNYNNVINFEQVIIVEGFMDVIALSKIGINNVVALMGVALSKEHIDKIKKHKEILIFLDNDLAGRLSTIKLINTLILNKINVFVLENNTKYKDVDDLIQSENGQEKVKNILDSKIRPIDFIYNYFFNQVEKENFEKIKEAILSISKLIKNYDQFFKLEIISKISNDFAINKEIISNYFDYQLNVVELKKSNKNINTKNTLEIELNEPLNINKVLISIWQNPTFLESQNIGKIKWPKANYLKIFKEIIAFNKENKSISKTSKMFLNEKLKMFSKQSLPSNILEFDELIIRTSNENRSRKIREITKLINDSNDDKYKDDLLEKKLEIISRKD